MHLFLTSSPSGCPYVPGPPVPVLDESNRFVELLRSLWPEEPPTCLMLAAFPEDFPGNDQMTAAFTRCFANAGLPFGKVHLCDARNAAKFPELLAESGFVMLSGGHVPTENRFWQSINAAQAFSGYDGIVMGVSAGTMNAADWVYAQPEEPGEASDPNFCRWLPGLGLTNINILPHFEVTRSWTLDGLRLVEDIALPDSFHRPLLALSDGSFVHCHNGRETLYGEAWLLENGVLSPLCENGQMMHF